MCHALFILKTAVREGEAQGPIQESVAASIQDMATNNELIAERRLITFHSH
jgi:hypothetical protein